ncbi:hypothetical protein [Pseudonocardia sp. ICBG1293]|uniref:hypothetical protein n=1 Tax=Pseudonocardia sp. ICBG1293 TaxID=2844382 RepID=UPI001CCC80FA|nr:hypothetical protein [Pseudonocardia sp. ICBG1293]
MAEVLGHLLTKRGFEHVLGEQFQQPVRAGQLQTARPPVGHHRRRSRLLGRELPTRPRLILG